MQTIEFVKRYPRVLAGSDGLRRLPWTDLTAQPAPFDQLVDPDVWQILAYANLGPSSHNVQPWTIVPTGRRSFVVETDRARWLPAIDPNNKELMLTIGAFVESACMAAAAMHLKATVTILSSDPTAAQIVSISVSHPSSPSSPCSPSSAVSAGADTLSLLMNRATDRREYKKCDLQVNHVAALRELDPLNVRYYARSSDKGEWIAKASLDAAKQASQDLPKQDELGNWFVNSLGAGLKTQLGLTPEALGINWTLRNLFYTAFLRSFLKSPTFASFSVPDAEKKLNAVSGFLVIYAPDNSVASLLACGRLYMRLLVTMTRLNVRHHTYSFLLQEAPWCDQVAGQLGEPDKRPMFVIRVGYVDAPLRPVSLRRPVRDIVSVQRSTAAPKSEA